MGDTETTGGEQARYHDLSHARKWLPWRIPNMRAKNDMATADPREPPDTNELREATHCVRETVIPRGALDSGPADSS
jgi:hypothetical protein